MLFPRRCPVCDEPVPAPGKDICPACEASLPHLRPPVCQRCGRPVSFAHDALCGDCLRTPHLFRNGDAVFSYQAMQRSIYRFKYHGRAEYASFYGRAMAELLRSPRSGLRREGPFDLLVPVPVAPKRLWERGYNQAALLARAVGEQTGLPVAEDLLCRRKETAPLKDQSPAMRRKSLSGAMSLNRLSYEIDVKSKNLLLVDDIFTTGATVDACAAPLLEAGAAKVCFLSLSISLPGEADDQRRESLSDDPDGAL